MYMLIVIRYARVNVACHLSKNVAGGRMAGREIEKVMYIFSWIHYLIFV